MARKQFVSSKKNAPSRAVSSKEAALHGRAGAAAAGADNENDDDDDDEEEEEGEDDASGDSDSGSNSPASSNGSSVLSSDEPDELSADADADANSPTVAVEVVPASVGRGKQLRFPTVISRGKESRVFGQGGADDDDDDDDDSDSDDSLLSIASDEEEDGDKSGGGDGREQLPPQTSATHAPSAHDDEDARGAKPQEDAGGVAEYPIKAFRARKRHRPDSGYYQQMSTYVRDCLLSVRDGGGGGSDGGALGASEVLSEAAHDEFRRKLSAEAVERVVWKETSPPAAEQPAEPAKSAVAGSEKKKKRPKKREEEEEEAAAAEQVKKETTSRKETASRKIKTEPTASASKPSSNSSASSAAATSTTSTSSKPSSSSRNSSNNNNNSSSSSTTTTTASSSNGAAVKVEVGKTPVAAPVATPEPVLCSSCKRKLSDVKDAEKPPPARKKSVTIVAPEARAESSRPPPVPATVAASRPPPAPAPAPASRSAVEPQGSFTIPTAGTRDVPRLRAEADRLNEEARALKHEGNDRGAAEAGAAGQIAQGKCYLRSSAKYFQNALKLADIKAAYKELGDEARAHTFGGFCLTTLTQTSSLIESTIRVFQAAGSRRMMALAYKFSAIAHLTIYRLQHTKLLSFYSDLFTPGRSPETRQNGTPTPPSGNASSVDSREAAKRSLLLKEMEHTLRGFEMWRRYEACNVVVLPRVSNPATTDLAVLFEELSSELDRA